MPLIYLLAQHQSEETIIAMRHHVRKEMRDGRPNILVRILSPNKNPWL